MKTLKPLVTLVVLLGLAAFVTIPKLYTMAQIRGLVPGRQLQSAPVLEKWHQDPEHHPGHRDTYWLRIGAGDIHVRGNHRLNVERTQWEALQVGHKLRLVRVPGGSEAYLEDGIYASNGNFLFDFALLLAEVGGVLYFGLQLRPRLEGQRWRPAA